MVNKSNKRIESTSSEIIRNLRKDHCRNLKKKIDNVNSPLLLADLPLAIVNNPIFVNFFKITLFL